MLISRIIVLHLNIQTNKKIEIMKTVDYLRLERKALVEKMNSTPEHFTEELKKIWKKLRELDEEIKSEQ